VKNKLWKKFTFLYNTGVQTSRKEETQKWGGRLARERTDWQRLSTRKENCEGQIRYAHEKKPSLGPHACRQSRRPQEDNGRKRQTTWGGGSSHADSWSSGSLPKSLKRGEGIRCLKNCWRVRLRGGDSALVEFISCDKDGEKRNDQTKRQQT